MGIFRFRYMTIEENKRSTAHEANVARRDIVRAIFPWRDIKIRVMSAAKIRPASPP